MIIPSIDNTSFDIELYQVEGEREDRPEDYTINNNAIVYKRTIVSDEQALQLLKDWMVLEATKAIDGFNKTIIETLKMQLPERKVNGY